MPTKAISFTLVLAIAILGLSAGCSDLMAPKMKCPGCGAELVKGSYCSKCEMLVTDAKGLVRCEKCNVEMPAGKYCKMCNKFVMTGEAKCPGCGTMMKAGELCAKCKMYAGSHKVHYCEKCKAPCGSAACGEKA